MSITSPTDPRRKKIAELLLAEMDQPLRWFYISVANERFLGGVYLKARGPTEAWTLLHSFNLYPRDMEAGTSTTEIPEEHQERIEAAKDKHYRLLTREEIDI